MIEEKIEKIVKEVLGENFKIYRIVDFENFLFVFYEDANYKNPYNDERLRIVSGEGPLKINKETFDYEITSLIEFHFEYGDNELFFPKESKTTFKESMENILKRGRINWEDFYLILENADFGQDEYDEYDVYSVNSMDNVFIKVKSEKAYNLLIKFLEKLKAHYIVDSNEKNKLSVNLNLSESP